MPSPFRPTVSQMQCNARMRETKKRERRETTRDGNDGGQTSDTWHIYVPNVLISDVARTYTPFLFFFPTTNATEMRLICRNVNECMAIECG